MLDYRTPHSPLDPRAAPPSQPRRQPGLPSDGDGRCRCNEWVTDWWMPPVAPEGVPAVLGTAAPPDATPSGAGSARPAGVDAAAATEGASTEGVDPATTTVDRATTSVGGSTVGVDHAGANVDGRTSTVEGSATRGEGPTTAVEGRSGAIEGPRAGGGIARAAPAQALRGGPDRVSPYRPFRPPHPTNGHASLPWRNPLNPPLAQRNTP